VNSIYTHVSCHVFFPVGRKEFRHLITDCTGAINKRKVQIMRKIFSNAVFDNVLFIIHKLLLKFNNKYTNKQT
jgi:hypothetical protein